MLANRDFSVSILDNRPQPCTFYYEEFLRALRNHPRYTADLARASHVFLSLDTAAEYGWIRPTPAFYARCDFDGRYQHFSSCERFRRDLCKAISSLESYEGTLCLLDLTDWFAFGGEPSRWPASGELDFSESNRIIHIRSAWHMRDYDRVPRALSFPLCSNVSSVPFYRDSTCESVLDPRDRRYLACFVGSLHAGRSSTLQPLVGRPGYLIRESFSADEQPIFQRLGDKLAQGLQRTALLSIKAVSVASTHACLLLPQTPGTGRFFDRTQSLVHDAFLRVCYGLRSSSQRRYLMAMKNARFAFCCGGHGPHSYRFLEALHCGCIPVLFEEEGWKKPFSEVLDYSGFCVTLPPGATGDDIDATLSNMSVEELRSKQRRGGEIYRSHFSSIQRQVDMLLRLLEHSWRDRSPDVSK